MKKAFTIFLAFTLVFTAFGSTILAKDNNKIETKKINGTDIHFVNSDSNSEINKEFLELLEKDLKKSKDKDKKDSANIMYIPYDGSEWTMASSYENDFLVDSYSVISGGLSIATGSVVTALSLEMGPVAAGALGSFVTLVTYQFLDDLGPNYSTTYLAYWWSDYYNKYVYRHVVYEYQDGYRNSDEVINIYLTDVYQIENGYELELLQY